MAMSGEEGQIEGSPRAALHFPESALVPETKLHLELRTLLYLFMKRAFADRALLGCAASVGLGRKPLGRA
jgi:hypothetical protein